MKATALEGDISEFPLTDIIQLVDLSKKTGAVHIQGQRASEQIEGWIYFRDGKIIGAEGAGLPPLEAVYAFFTVSSGPFKVYDDVVLERPTITVSNEVIIMEGIMRQDAWESIQEHVPSLSMVPRLIPNPASGTTEINLEAEEWRVLTMVNGKNTVAQIAQKSGLGEFRACQIIAELLTNGLIEEREMQPAERVFPQVEQLLTNAVGNNAQALLQDACGRAGVPDPTSATSQQVFVIIDHLDHSLTALLGKERARQLAEELRQLSRKLLDQGSG
jgi:hypothetical protein